MNIKIKVKYKSLNPFEWNDIPKFAILTGPNGVGKSQILNLVKDRLSSNGSNVSNIIDITNFRVNPNEVIYSNAIWNLPGQPISNMSNIQIRRKNLFSEFKQQTANYNFDHLKSIFAKIAADIGKNIQEINEEEFFKFLPDTLLLNYKQPVEELSNIFYEYKVNLIEKLASGMPESEYYKIYGNKPWKILEDIIAEANLPFGFTNPENVSIKDSFTLQVFNKITNDRIQFTELSSGEKVIISLVFYLFNSQTYNVFPKLMILDEPDAHLHPSMTNQFIEVINNVLVEKYNVRVIMTTHSPSTIALAPPNSVFDMRSNPTNIFASSSKNNSISQLTAGLVYIGKGTKHILVEDEADVEFYQIIFRLLIESSRVDSNIPLNFIPASTKIKSGGKSVVASWVEKLKKSGLNELIFGLIDKDSDNEESDGVFLLSRYSFENFLVDPIVVFAILLEHDQVTDLASEFNLRIGEEHKLKNLSTENLQKISNHIHSLIEGTNSRIKDSNPNNEYVSCDYGNNIKIDVPKWLYTMRGKDLLNYYISHFTPEIIKKDRLLRSIRKINLIPVELEILFKKIQLS